MFSLLLGLAMSKRTLDSFFSPPSKKSKTLSTIPTTKSATNGSANYSTLTAPTSGLPVLERDADSESEPLTYTLHKTYPIPIANPPSHLSAAIEDILLASNGKEIKNQPHLDLLYFQPLLPKSDADDLFKYLRSSLPFYRVKYSIARFGKSLDINTPRFTTVFGVDETSRFASIHGEVEAEGDLPLRDSSADTDTATTCLRTRLVDTLNPTRPVAPQKYHYTPRPIPPALSLLLHATEALTGETFNFCLVNYYASGSDSISYHSDDERFLGPNPAIASFTLGARRDFLMKHKPAQAAERGKPAIETEGTSPIKLNLASGDMVLMRGETQSHWLHSIPKRKGGEADRGRINITLRKAMVPAGTENYYRYNVGEGEVYRWDEKKKEMVAVG